MLLSELVRMCSSEVVDIRGDCEIDDLAMDTRKPMCKALFFCITGARYDSHRFAEQAVKNGAVCLAVEKWLDDVPVPQVLVNNGRKAMTAMSQAFFGYPARGMKILGVTGTKGKTTTSYLMKAIMEKAGYKCGLIGTTGNMIGYTIWEGWNHMDGATALAYSRERYAFADGDNQRGRNQMEVVKGVINACTSPQILSNYMEVLNSAEGCFETSIPYSVMADLVRFQLDYGGDWDIITYSVSGEGASQPTFSSQSYAFVFIPDYNTVNVAIDLLDRMAAGEVISDPNAGQ